MGYSIDRYLLISNLFLRGGSLILLTLRFGFAHVAVFSVGRSVLCLLDCHVSGRSIEEFSIEGRSARLHLYEDKITGE